MVGRRMAAVGVTAAIASAGLGTAPAWGTEDALVEFADAAFRACVNAALEQPGDATVSISQASGLEHLDCYSSAITSISGVEALTNLGSLLLSRNQISELTPLAGLTTLWYLEADSNQIHDLTPLAGLAKLSYVAINDQTTEMSIPCGTPTANPVTAAGTVVPLTGTGYDVASAEITAAAAGTYEYSWNADILDHPDRTGSFAGTLTVTCTGDPAPSGGSAIPIPDQPALLPDATFRPCLTPDFRKPGQRLSSLTGTPTCHDDNAPSSDNSYAQPVHIPDPQFRACINLELGQPTGAVITRTQAASIRHLRSCFSRGITSLTGAEALTSLVTLGAYDNRIHDLTPLAGLTTLQHLSLESNNISDVSPLSGLTNLGHLGLYNPQWLGSAHRNSVTDLSPLAHLPQLVHLSAYNQEAAASVECGSTYPNPVTSRYGTPIPLSGTGYDPAANTIDITTPGPHTYTWTGRTSHDPGLWNDHVGTLTLTTTC